MLLSVATRCHPFTLAKRGMGSLSLIYGYWTIAFNNLEVDISISFEAQLDAATGPDQSCAANHQSFEGWKLLRTVYYLALTTGLTVADLDQKQSSFIGQPIPTKRDRTGGGLDCGHSARFSMRGAAPRLLLRPLQQANITLMANRSEPLSYACFYSSV